MGPTTFSELFAVVAAVVRDGFSLCEVLCKFAESCSMRFIHVGSAGCEPGKCVGESEAASASFCFPC